MADIATISLRADTSSLEQGDKALDHFGQTAEKATKQADGLNDAFKAGAQSQKQNNESLKQQQQALQDLLAKINPVNNALNKLDDMQLQLSKFRSQGIVDDRTYRESAVAIGRARQELTAAAEASTKAGRAAAEQAAADRAATTAKENFITRLREQTELQGKTASQVQEYKAAQLGMTQQAAPFIARLKEQEDAWKKGTVSAGQYRMAMRQLPMQFTDIATSIAGGMPLYMIAIQQGGQIKDSFGGIGNASKALLSLITPMTVGLVGAAAVVGGLALAYYKGAAENEEFNKQLALTGGYAGKTAAQLSEMSKGMVTASITQSDAAYALAKVVGSGFFKTDQLEAVTKAAVAMQDATGQSVDETIKNFQRLYSDPTSASLALNEQLHYLTAAQYQYISSLERRGDKELAGKYAAELYSKNQQEVANKVTASIGLIEKAAKAGSKYLKIFWDVALDVGRTASESERLNEINDYIAAKEKEAQVSGKMPKIVAERIAQLQVEKKNLEFVTSSQNGYVNAQNKIREANEKRIKGLQVSDEYEDRLATKSQKRTKELTKLWRDVAENPDLYSESRRKDLVDEINARNKDRKEPKQAAYHDDAATKALLDSQARVAALREQATVTLTMTDQEKQLAKFTQQIADLKSKTILTADQKSLLARSGEITASMQLEAQLSRENAERKKATAALKQMDDYTTTIANRNAQAQAKFGKTSKQASRVDQEFQLDNTFDKQKEGVTGAALEKLTESYNKAKFELKAGFDQEDLNEGDWLAGMTQGLEQYGETANNVFSATAQLAQTTMGSMTSMATQMMTTGSANVKQFATNFLTSIVDIINRLLIAQAIQVAMGWISGGASAGTGAAANSSFSGGAYNNLTFAYDGGYIPQYDRGGYTGDGGKFEPKGVVHGGEFVFTKEATNRIGIDNLYKMMRGYADGGLVSNAVTATAPMLGMQGGGNNITVGIGDVVIMSDSQKENNASNSQDIGAGIQKQLKPAIVATISEQLRIPGTPLWMAMNGNR